MACPQRTVPWLNWRKDRGTASNFGSASGHNPYCSPLQLVIEMLFKSFQGNEATQWGQDHEALARDEYVAWLRAQAAVTGDVDPDKIWCDETGLMVCVEKPYFAVSPDGIVHLGDGTLRLLEIKCPFKKRLYGEIPRYYYDQIQGIMGLMRLNGLVLEGCDFVVWTPDKIAIQHFPYNAQYFERDLLPALERWYLQLYVPSAILFEAGELKQGETAFTTVVVCDEASTPPRHATPGSAQGSDFFNKRQRTTFGSSSAPCSPRPFENEASTINEDALALIRQLQQF
jgi:putative phage-type endonuclease